MTKKTDLLDKAHQAGLGLSAKNTIAELEAALKESASQTASADFAKAGRRSRKAVTSQTQEAIRQARKQAAEAQPVAPVKVSSPTPRPKLERRGKKYQAVHKQLEPAKLYSQAEALKLVKATTITKFDGAVELHLRLNLDPKQADQNIRSNVVLPAGTGRSIRVAVYADGEDTSKAVAAGADIAGDDDFLAQLDEAKLDFDILITNPQSMAKLSRYAKLLGPRGLMPNPKSGTINSNLARAVKQAKQGQVEYRLDEQGIIHLAIGRVSFSSQQLTDNLEAVISSIKANKPASLKGNYIISSSLTSTMGPGIAFQIN